MLRLCVFLILVLTTYYVFGVHINYQGFSNPTLTWFEGGAFQTSDRMVTLSTANYNQHGHMFYIIPLPLKVGSTETPFNFKFNFMIDQICTFAISDEFGQYGADGLTLILAELLSGSIYDRVGGGVGFLDVPSSVAFEIDTWHNGEYGDIDSNHVGIDLNGSVNSVSQCPITDRLDNGLNWTAWFDYNGTSLNGYVSSDGVKPANPQVQYPIVLSTFLQSDRVYVGFGAATGSACERLNVLSLTIDYSCPGCTSPVCSDCQNGNCVGSEVCNCLEGWYGTACNTQVAPTCSGGCVHGVCLDQDKCVCSAGWSGANCNTPVCFNGTFSTYCNCFPVWTGISCDEKYCPAQTINGATFPGVYPSGNIITGSCPVFPGNATATCGLDGTYHPIDISCPKFCPAGTYGNAYFPNTLPSTQPINGSCNSPFGGVLTAYCDDQGNWYNIGTGCVYCPGTNLKGVYFSDSLPSDTSINGTCSGPNAHGEIIQAQCGADGQWHNVTGDCPLEVVILYDYSQYDPEYAQWQYNSYPPQQSWTFLDPQSGRRNLPTSNVWFGFNLYYNTVLLSAFGIMTVTPPNGPAFSFTFDGSYGCLGTTAFCSETYCPTIVPELETNLVGADPNGQWNFTLTLLDQVTPFTVSLYVRYRVTTNVPTAAPTQPPTSTPPPNCPNQNYAYADWPQSAPGNITIACSNGYSGIVSRICLNTGVWSTSVLGTCTRLKCNATTEGNANWPQTNSLLNATGTCIPPYAGSVHRTCQGDGTFGSINGVCTITQCPFQTYASVDWPPSNPGTVTSPCNAGYSGNVTRVCALTGVWSTSVSGTCTRLKCNATTEGNANWPQTNSLLNATGTCIAPYTGSVHRTCQGDGTFGPIGGVCSVSQCPFQTYASVDWPPSNPGTVTQPCNAGYSGSVTRVCGSNSVWSTSVSGTCTRLKCNATTEGNANWPQTNSLMTANGTCIAPYTGTPTRACLASGTFDTIVNPCILPVVANCSGQTYGLQTFLDTLPGTTATGVCVPKSASHSGKSPTRKCLSNGTWATLVNDICFKIQCPATIQNNAIFPATNYGQGLIGSCISGTGSVYMFCDDNANWGTPTGVCA